MQIDGMGVMSWPSARKRLMGEEGAGDAAFARQLGAVNRAAEDVGNAVKGVAGAGGAGGAGGAAAGGAAAGATGGAGGQATQPQSSADAINALASNGTGARPTGESAATAADVQDRFLKLLVAQMRNQDPLNPMDNAAVTSQMAQISTVQGIETLNKTLGDWVKTNGTGSAMGSASLIGRDVLGSGERFTHDPTRNSGAVTLGFKLNEAARDVQVDIVDAGGHVLNTRTLSGQDAGLHTFEWDGRDAGGRAVAASTLSVRVAASDGAKPVQSEALVPRRVIGVAQTATGAQLQFQGGGSAPASDIPMIL